MGSGRQEAVPSQQDVTNLLLAWGQGEDEALDKLIPQVEAELRRRARRCLAGERSDHTLQTTALVNEAFLKLIDCRRVNWQNRTQFLALSARLMRRILVDYARARLYQKRGGGAHRVTFDEGVVIAPQRSDEWPALDEALNRLAEFDPRKSQVVELRFFGGLSVAETAQVLEVSEATVLRDWRLAKVWLLRELSRDGGG